MLLRVCTYALLTIGLYSHDCWVLITAGLLAIASSIDWLGIRMYGKKSDEDSTQADIKITKNPPPSHKY